MEKVYYFTTPIYYVNASPHIGHAYTPSWPKSWPVTTAVSATGPFSHRNRRARDKIAEAAAKAASPPRNSPTVSAPSSGISGPSCRLPTIISSARPTRTTSGPSRPSSRKSTTGRHIFRPLRGLLLCRLRALLHGEGTRRRQMSRSPDASPAPQGKQLLLKMSAYQDWLIHTSRIIRLHPSERYRNEVLAFLRNPWRPVHLPAEERLTGESTCLLTKTM